MEKVINPFSPAFKSEAYSIYEELRKEKPVFQVKMPNGDTGWIISRYEDAVSLLKDQRITKSPHSLMTSKQFKSLSPEIKMINNHLLSSDPPDHTRLRKLIQKAFTSKMINSLQPRIQKITEQLIDKMITKSKVDIIKEFAFPLPITVISEMLGVPVKDQDQFHEWSSAVLYAFNRPDRFLEIHSKLIDFLTYLKDLVEQRRYEPKDDLISELIKAEEEGDKLSEEEIFSMIYVLMIGGHETTVNLIGNGIFCLLQHPEQLHMLKNDSSLINSTIEECLRFMSPVEFATNRWAKEDIHLHGETIKTNEAILISIGSANRDSEKFNYPENFDITRKKNEHIAFGQGIHFCIGFALARLEGQIALKTIFNRLPDLQLAVEPSQLEWQESFIVRGFKELPIRLK